jgi:Ferritin-like
MTGVLSHRDAIVRLLDVAEPDRDLEWIKEALQAAVALELATIPPYLCAYWSIKNPDKRGPSRTASRILLDILYQEMRHLGLVCNMLNAVGGRPMITAALTAYPTRLPGGVKPELEVSLGALSEDQLRVFMDIEAPEEPLARLAGPPYPTIGKFYEDLQAAFAEVKPQIKPEKQQIARVLDLVAITSLDDVSDAIESIREQGEGTSKSPEPNGELAHYYRFGELLHQRALEFDETTGEWDFTGRPVPRPDPEEIHSMATLPAGGWTGVPADARKALDAFNAELGRMLGLLDTAWQEGNVEAFHNGIALMNALTPLAVAVMSFPIPSTPGKTYGPDFRIVSPPPV